MERWYAVPHDGRPIRSHRFASSDEDTLYWMSREGIRFSIPKRNSGEFWYPTKKRALRGFGANAEEIARIVQQKAEKEAQQREAAKLRGQRVARRTRLFVPLLAALEEVLAAVAATHQHALQDLDLPPERVAEIVNLIEESKL